MLLFRNCVFLLCPIALSASLALTQQIERVGGAPNDHDVYANLAKTENFGKVGDLFLDMINKQNPMISKENLLKIVKARQESIKDFRCRYTVFAEMFGVNQNFDILKKISYEFGRSGDRLYLEYEPHNSGMNDPPKKMSYDGNSTLSLLNYRDGHLHAGIAGADVDSLRTFFQPHMPLILAKLFEISTYGGDLNDSSLLSFLQSGSLYAILEKKESIGEHECIVIADLSMRIYLDPQKDFSVIQSDGYRQEFSGGVLIGRWLSSRTRLFDLNNHDNGVWIPSEIVIENFDKRGEVIARHRIDVSLIEINKGIDDGYFTGFIPDDTLVADATTGLAYFYGERPSINGLLQATVQSKRVWIFQIISMTLGIILILIWIIIKYRKYRASM